MKSPQASADVLSAVQHLFPSARVDGLVDVQSRESRADYVLSVDLGGQTLDLRVEFKTP